jgi:hypothetical protein
LPLGAVGAVGVTVPGAVVLGVAPGVVGAVLPAVQSTLELPRGASAVPKNPVDSASGLPLVLRSPAYTRTTTRFMVVMDVSK